jgi:methyltransferase (TIGR00027 family)
MVDTPIENVSDTAFWVAHYRAVEGARPRPLFHDPLAGVLTGERGKDIAAAMPNGRFTAWAVAVRTVLIDDFITRVIGEGVDTVMNLGAGLDTRPYRMQLPASLNWIEVDYPRVIEFKEQRLAGERPRCKLERVKCDLADREARRKLFARVDGGAKKMLIITEGVLPYLSEEAVGALADDLFAMQHAAYWIIDYFGPSWLKYRTRMHRRLRNAPFKFAPADWFGFFSAHGWKRDEVRYLVEEAERLRRPVDMPFWMRAGWMLRMAFMSRHQRAGMRRVAGYALMTPKR